MAKKDENAFGEAAALDVTVAEPAVRRPKTIDSAVMIGGENVKNAAAVKDAVEELLDATMNKAVELGYDLANCELVVTVELKRGV